MSVPNDESVAQSNERREMGLEVLASMPGEGMVKLGYMNIAVSVMTVSIVNGVKYHVIHRWWIVESFQLNLHFILRNTSCLS